MVAENLSFADKMEVCTLPLRSFLVPLLRDNRIG